VLLQFHADRLLPHHLTYRICFLCMVVHHESYCVRAHYPYSLTQAFGCVRMCVLVYAEGKRFCVWKSLLERDSGRRGTEPQSYAQLLAELQRLRASQGIFVVILLRGRYHAQGCALRMSICFMCLCVLLCIYECACLCTATKPRYLCASHPAVW
jgi:hypothetical protein